MNTTMIRKTIYVAVALIIAMSQPMAAQEVETVNPQPKDSVSLMVDSLQQVVSALSTTVKKNSDDLRNQAIWKNRAKYFNIAYANQSLTWKEVDGTWKSKMGAGLTIGKTYYLHKKPILGMIKFGIDWSYFDINFAMYDNKYVFPDSYNDGEDGNYYYPDGHNNGSNDNYYPDYEEDDDSDDMYQGEIGMQIGPSITINPVSHLKISGYFRYVPCASILYVDSEVSCNYASFFVCGGAISYKAISLGVEGRWGSAKYKSLLDTEDVESNFTGGGKEKQTWKTGATRFYISFRY